MVCACRLSSDPSITLFGILLLVKLALLLTLRFFSESNFRWACISNMSSSNQMGSDGKFGRGKIYVFHF
jgi:hypothetical protein